jgi:cell wall-associated NlpC family hydrolase
MRIRTLFCTFAVLGTVLAAAPAGAQSVSSLRAKLERAGQHLDEVTERYNEARLRRSGLDSKLEAARSDLAVSEAKLGEVRKWLGVAVRDLYMHPAGGLATFFQARSYSEIQRANSLGARAALASDGLILEIRKAKAEEAAAAGRLKGLRDKARAEELRIGEERRAAAAALVRTQALLSPALARELEAERLAGLAAAKGLALARIHFAGPVRPGAAAAVRAAYSQIGKPYRWGAAGPNAYDCSGLTMWSWAHGGVSLPHSSRSQYASLPHVPLSQLAPGDLVFSGSPIHHVAIYAGNGVAVHAPHSGQSVRAVSVWSLHPVGASRP